ncbi:two pore domain potassium channel family protein [Rhodovarius crocodyli]|uniref:Two pore domain potassium channel family protein n=1 Tax=Rhodovarius crocodyli TaxID=1979269 RepID=A0A437MMP8_9PROT|nr:potassium channel family protein [Rhodovarius crocodyli]RVT98924.1 two pore domain potassium channel family protein [Rhodovarius crocodyli]
MAEGHHLRRKHRRTALMNGAVTASLMLLVAAAAGDQGWLFSVAALGVAAATVLALYVVFPQGMLFALGVANGLAVYMCLYVVIGRSAFPDALPWARPVGFVMPVAAFLSACLYWRSSLRQIASEGLNEADITHLPRFLRWFVLCGVVGVLSLSSPFNRESPQVQTATLFLAMGVISLISIVSVRDVVRLLVDVAAILTLVARRLRFLMVPMATYVSLFTMMAVAFGCFYRIADGLSREPLFRSHDVMARIDFSEALHFSVVTLTTVGYGDIMPVDDGIRILAAIEMVTGQLLLLFGFAEIMRSRGRAE